MRSNGDIARFQTTRASGTTSRATSWERRGRTCESTNANERRPSPLSQAGDPSSLATSAASSRRARLMISRPERRSIASSSTSSSSGRDSRSRRSPRKAASLRSTYLPFANDLQSVNALQNLNHPSRDRAHLQYASYVSHDRGGAISRASLSLRSLQSRATPGKPLLDHVPRSRSTARVASRISTSALACSGFVPSARCAAKSTSSRQS